MFFILLDREQRTEDRAEIIMLSGKHFIRCQSKEAKKNRERCDGENEIELKIHIKESSSGFERFSSLVVVVIVVRLHRKDPDESDARNQKLFSPIS
jgi:hypothetical protein